MADLERRAREVQQEQDARDPLKQKWGADRRDADAFIMTQLMHTELAIEGLKFLVFLVALTSLAYAGGYHEVAWGILVLGFAITAFREREVKNRHARISRLMDRNQD